VPVHGLRAAGPPPRWRTGASRAFPARQLHPKLWDPGSRSVPVVCALEAPMRHVAGTCEAGRQQAGSAQASAEPLPGPHLFFDERKKFGGKYGWKIVIDVHGRKRVHSLLACK